MRTAFTFALALGSLAVACEPHREPVAVDVETPVMQHVVDAEAPPVVNETQPGDLEPGTLRAFGVLMPIGTVSSFDGPDTKIFYVQTSMARMMRYLQRRLDILNADIHPLGAMIHNAHVRTAPDGENRFVDVGVRQDGDRVMVSFWNQSGPTVVVPRTREDGLRAAGFDPRTGMPLQENNH